MATLGDLVGGAIAGAGVVAAIYSAVAAKRSKEAAEQANRLAQGVADRAALQGLLALVAGIRGDAGAAARLGPMAKAQVRSAAAAAGTFHGSATDQLVREVDAALELAASASAAVEEAGQRFAGLTELDDALREEVHRRTVALQAVRLDAAGALADVEQLHDDARERAREHVRAREAARIADRP